MAATCAAEPDPPSADTSFPPLAPSSTNDDRHRLQPSHLTWSDSPLLHAVDRSSRPISRHAAQSRPATATRSRSESKMVTPQEYDMLPPSIQKKYFSSVERLRIAQQSAADKRKRRPSKESAVASRPSIDLSPRPKSAHSRGGSSLFPMVRPHSRREVDMLEDEALRFLSLPDKVKKLHFSSEEQTKLAQKAQQVLNSRIPQDPESKREIVERHQSIDSMRSTLPVPFVEADQTDSASLRGSRTSTSSGCTRNRHDSTSSCSSRSSGRPSMTMLPSTGSLARSRSRPRALSLAPIPLPPPTLTPAVPPLPPPAVLETMGRSLRSADSMPVLRDGQPATKYYKDNHARLRLREYVLSPEKFDEALEFGFPSSEGAAATRSVSAPFTPTSPAETEPDCESIGTYADVSEDDTAPRTPTLDAEPYPSSISHHPSIDSGVALPLSPDLTPTKSSVRSISPDLAGREMTLRLTLTRPELRTPDVESRATPRKSVSVDDAEVDSSSVLFDLSVYDDQFGVQGVHRSCQIGSIKKMWKNIRGR